MDSRLISFILFLLKFPKIFFNINFYKAFLNKEGIEVGGPSKIFKKRWFIHSVFLGVVLTTILEDGSQFKWGFVALLICLDRSINFILLRRGL